MTACDQGPQQAAQPPPAPPPVTVAKPVVKDIVEWDEYPGRFEAMAEVDVRARVAGYLDAIHFKDGAFVKQGDLLFVIDRRPYQAAANRSEAAVNAARTRLDWAKSELERAERLVRSGATAERTLDERRQQHDTAQADLNGARAALEETRLNLGFTEIRAPISGRISRRLVTEGNLVAANETLLTTIVALDPIYFYFDVDERSFLAYARMVRQGTMASPRETAFEVMVALADERQAGRKGRLDFIDNRMDQATGTMRARAVFENKDLLLSPGLFGRIQVPASGSYRGVLVPDEAIAADQDRRIVYVVAADGKVKPTVIRPGPRIDGYRVVRSGLTGDETIIVGGIQRVRFSDRVTPQMTSLPPSR